VIPLPASVKDSGRVPNTRITDKGLVTIPGMQIPPLFEIAAKAANSKDPGRKLPRLLKRWRRDR
jgi:hypothetical protein